jgi:hypothetical protein
MCDLLVENRHLVPKSDLEHLDDDGDYMYLAKVDESEISGAEWKKKMEQLKKVINFKVGAIEKQIYDFSGEVVECQKLQNDQFSSQFLKTCIRNELVFKKTLNKISNMVGDENRNPRPLPSAGRKKPDLSPLGLAHNQSVAVRI